MAESITEVQPDHPSKQAKMPFPGEKGFPAGGGRNVPLLLLRYRKSLLFVAASLMLAGFLSLLMWTSETPYRPIYASMSEKDAAAVVEHLQKEHIPYRLQGNGIIMVPSDQVYQVRLKLASEGITPQGSAGFEIFDNSNEFGLSDFTRKINLQRAMQGELARTIEVMPQVSAARVHLVLPKESAFAERERKATASVMLQLSGSGRLPKTSVTAIQNLVAASVPKLDPADVTIVDASGTLLSTNEKEAPMSEGQSLEEYQSRLERRMEARLTGMLEQVVGEGMAVVRVTADIDRQFVEQNSTRFNPDEQVLRSRKSVQESRSSSSSATNAMGVPGLASNTPGANSATGGASAPASQAPKDSASRNESLDNYEISTTHEHRIIPYGKVNKLSVAVVVGGTTTTNDKGETTFTPKSQEELRQLQQLVQRAIGYDEERGDSVVIQSMPLMDISSDADAESLAKAESRALYIQLARYVVAALALILLAWFVLRPLAQRILQESSKNRQGHETGTAAHALPGISAEARERLMNIEQARLAITQEPDRATRVLREWVDPA